MEISALEAIQEEMAVSTTLQEFLFRSTITGLQIAAAACAEEAIISKYSTIGAGSICDLTRQNVFNPDWDTQYTTIHDIEAVYLEGYPVGPDAREVLPGENRKWYNAEAECNKLARADYSKFWNGEVGACDEYPFHSNEQGAFGDADGDPPSLMLVPSSEQSLQGGKLSGFYSVCHLTTKTTCTTTSSSRRARRSRTTPVGTNP